MKKLFVLLVLLLFTFSLVGCDKQTTTEEVTCQLKEVVIVDINTQNIIMEHKTTFKTTIYSTPSDAEIPIEATIGDSVYIQVCDDGTVTITGKVYVPITTTTEAP